MILGRILFWHGKVSVHEVVMLLEIVRCVRSVHSKASQQDIMMNKKNNMYQTGYYDDQSITHMDGNRANQCLT